MPDEESKKPHHFIEYLTGLTTENDRGALAVLRRGLGYPPGQDVNMYRYVARFVPEEARGREREKVYYLIAALYAFHQLSTTDNLNFGDHMAKAASLEKDPTATERRFTVLLNANSTDLADYLRQAVSFLKSRKVKVEINWNNLFEDLKRWDLPGRPTQRRWANAFWGYQKPAEENPSHSAQTIKEN
jgi:CRISPR system Cascade subunit CasB